MKAYIIQVKPTMKLFAGTHSKHQMARAMDEDTSCQEYVDGSIFRVRMHNFLTYEDAEFHPGPRLNLVLGPNGTGKSSIVCALAVGLAGSTKLLGRADKVGQFVRHEKDVGFTEIELYFERGNKVIRRTIYRDNKSVWELNGRSSTLAQVTQLMQSSRIQIDNLCQFLPQDKVGEFSRMNPIQLLRATEDAFMEGDLASNHDQLMKMQQDMSNKRQELETLESALELKKSENREREKEVQRISEHESRIHETEVMEKKCLWLQVDDMYDQIERVQKERDECKENMKKAKEEKVTPLLERLEKEKLELENIQTNAKDMETNKRSVERDLVDIRKQSERSESEQTNTVTELKNLRNHHHQTKRRLEHVEENKSDYERKQSELPTKEELKDTKNELEARLRRVDGEHGDIQFERQNKVRELRQAEHAMEKLEHQVSRLGDESAQRRRALQQRDPDAIRALDWAQQHRQRLRGHVYGPVALELQVRNAQYAKYIENTLPWYVQAALVVECKEDYDTLLNGFRQQNIKASVLNVEGGRSRDFTRPYTDQDMDYFRREYGIEGYLDEMINAPEIIHEVTRAHGGVHTVLVGTQTTEDVINRGGRLFDDMSSHSRKSMVLTPSKKYVTSVSKYGDRNATTKSMDLKGLQLLGGGSTDPEEERDLKDRLEQAKASRDRLRSDSEELKERERVLSGRRSELEKQVHDTRSKMKLQMQLEQKMEAADERIRGLKQELERDLSQQEDALIRQLRRQVQEQENLISLCLERTKKLLTISAKDATYKVALSCQDTRVKEVEKLLMQAKASIQEYRDAFQRAKDRLLQIARQASAMKKKAEQKSDRQAMAQEFARFSDDLDELQARIGNNRAALESFRGDLSVRDVYERTCREIEREEMLLAEMQGKVANGRGEMDEIKQRWHSQLQDVVKQIDASFKEYFADIGCVGEVLLKDEDGDISKWGIERRAQFRRNASLTTMTAEEQSGGEKSVGTIMYLMALQTLTSCPFRVVDEINQGMDQYNERKVFQRMTKSACGAKLPQYFLITPKLITGLDYHRDTKVMIIKNGPWNKVEQALWDVETFIQSIKKRQSEDHVGPTRKRIKV